MSGLRVWHPLQNIDLAQSLHTAFGLLRFHSRSLYSLRCFSLLHSTQVAVRAAAASALFALAATLLRCAASALRCFASGVAPCMLPVSCFCLHCALLRSLALISCQRSMHDLEVAFTPSQWLTPSQPQVGLTLASLNLASLTLTSLTLSD